MKTSEYQYLIGKEKKEIIEEFLTSQSLLTFFSVISFLFFLQFYFTMIIKYY